MTDPTSASKQRAEADAILDHARAFNQTQIIETPASAEALIVSKPDGRSIINITDMLDTRLPAPRRRKGLSRHETLPSLIAHIRRFRDDGSAGFVSPTNKRVVAVLDYNAAGGPDDDKQRWGQHLTEWRPTLHESWQRWRGRNETLMTPSELGEHLEDSTLDLIDPPAPDGGHRAKELLLLAERMHVKWGTPADVIGLSKDFKLRTESEVVNVQSLQSGATHMVFKEDHTDASGAKLTVPGLFLIAIPVFEGDPKAYRMAVKLRYRKKGAGVVWSYSLHNWEDVLRAAWDGVADQLAAGVKGDAENGTDFPVFMGAPEGSSA